MTLQDDKTYIMRNGKRVYVIKTVFTEPDRVTGYCEDGIHQRFHRDSGIHWDYFFGGRQFNSPQYDIVGEALQTTDLRDEYLAKEDHRIRQRAALDSFEGDPDSYKKYRAWNRANRPPGPLGAGLKESDYD